MKRTWTPDYSIQNAKSNITLYDFGAFVGQLVEIVGEEPKWQCWEVIKREKMTDGQILEILQETSEDWSPFDAISCETYPLKIENGSYKIPGWCIVFNGD
jgi:hypothetical protein